MFTLCTLKPVRDSHHNFEKSMFYPKIVLTEINTFTFERFLKYVMVYSKQNKSLNIIIYTSYHGIIIITVYVSILNSNLFGKFINLFRFFYHIKICLLKENNVHTIVNRFLSFGIYYKMYLLSCAWSRARACVYICVHCNSWTLGTRIDFKPSDLVVGLVF